MFPLVGLNWFGASALSATNEPGVWKALEEKHSVGFNLFTGFADKKKI